MDVQSALSLALVVVVVAGVAACIYDYALATVLRSNEDLDSLKRWAEQGNLPSPQPESDEEEFILSDPDYDLYGEPVDSAELDDPWSIVIAEYAPPASVVQFQQRAQLLLTGAVVPDYSSMTNRVLMRLIKEQGLYRPGMSKFNKAQMVEVLVTANS